MMNETTSKDEERADDHVDSQAEAAKAAKAAAEAAEATEAEFNALSSVCASAESEPAASRFLRSIGLGFVVAAKLFARGAKASHTGATVLRDQLDPDLRTQFAEFPILGLSQLLPKDRPLRSGSTGDRIVPGPSNAPVVLVHGLGGSAGNFGMFRTFLGFIGRTHVHAFDYRREPRVELALPRFQAYLREVLSLYDEGTKIQIVGHSLGGLLSRAALQDDELRARVELLVTLGSPHQGTHLARLGGTPYTTDLRPGSALFELLDAPEARRVERDELAITAFWTPRDVLVIPGDAAKLDGATNIEMPEATHVSWLMRPRQIHQILRALEVRGERSAATEAAADATFVPA